MHAFALALLLLTGCGSPGDLPLRAPATKSAPPVSAVAEQSSPIEVRVGEAFDIVLPSNPWTGHQWMVEDSLDPRLRFKERTYLPDRSARAGSSGHDRLSFVGVAPGEAVLRLWYSREVQRSAARTAEFGVRIHPAQQ